MPKPPRVAYLLADLGIPYFDSRKGSSIHARSMVRALEQEGCAVDVFVLRKGRTKVPGMKAREVARGWRSRVWQNTVIKRGPWPADAPPNWVDAVQWLVRHADFLRETRDRLRREPPDLLYARHGWLAYPYARLKRELKVPLVLEVNAVMSIEKAARGELAWPGRTRRIEREAFEAADLILPVSSEIAAQIVGFGIDPARIVVTPNAVDAELFHPRKPPPAAAQWGERFLVGSVSSFRAYHGTATLLRAAAQARERIPGLYLRLLGAGPQWDEMQALAGQLGIAARVEFPGVVDHAAVPELLRECDLCVSPNEGEHNQYNCPMKLFEYMALEVPIVASAWGDIPNIVRDGETALLHRPADAADLARAMLEVYSDAAGARRRALAARDLVATRTWRHVARGILDRCLGSRS